MGCPAWIEGTVPLTHFSKPVERERYKSSVFAGSQFVLVLGEIEVSRI